MLKDTLRAAAGATLLLTAWPALAEPSQRLTTAPGVPLPLAVESSARADCSLGEAPEMRVVTPPTHGELSMREGRLRRRGSDCPPAPGYVVMYVPDQDFNGADRVSIELSDGKIATVLDFEITIEGATSLPPDLT